MTTKYKVSRIAGTIIVHADDRSEPIMLLTINEALEMIRAILAELMNPFEKPRTR